MLVSDSLSEALQHFALERGLALSWRESPRYFEAQTVGKPCESNRLDKLLVDRALAASRERAQALILAGKVLVDDQKSRKQARRLQRIASIRLLGEDLEVRQPRRTETGTRT